MRANFLVVLFLAGCASTPSGRLTAYELADAGTLQAGKSADFIVLDANPLDDIANTRRIAAVVLRGTAVTRTSLGPQ